MTGSTSLHTLIEIHLEGCTQCEHLPPLSLLPLLKILYLSRMDRVKHICRTSIGSNATVKAFPSLEILVLFRMLSLEEWSDNEGTAVVFPQLVHLRIVECPKLTAMPVLPVLKELRLMPGNRMLLGQVKGGTQSLEHLILKGCEDLAQPPLEDDDQMRDFYGSLRSLEIERCNWLFSVPESSEAPLGFWKSLTSLEELIIGECDALVRWPEVEFQDLISLKHLFISGCPLAAPSPSPGERGILPQLNDLSFWGSGLVQLPKCPASLRDDVEDCRNLQSLEEGLRHATALESMTINGCPSLTSLPTQLGHNTGLKDLTISRCAQLSSLPEGLEGLTALQHLMVEDCPCLTLFPDGLLERLPGLKKLIIRGCPSLERRCKEGGEYWHLVSGIPHKEITPSSSGQSSTT